jgi:hypothetical protein
VPVAVREIGASATLDDSSISHPRARIASLCDMTSGKATQRLSMGAISAALALAMIPAGTATAQLDPDLVVTLELPDGYIDHEIEPDTLSYFDEENQPFAIAVIDGCAINGHYWIFAAGLSGVPLQLSVVDRATGEDARPLLPPFEPGAPIGTVFDPDALAICGDDIQMGGLPPLDAQVSYASANERYPDITSAMRLLSDGAQGAYRRIAQADQTYPIITRRPPIAAVDESDDLDRLMLFIEGRVPHSVEGIVLSGPEGMLPPRAQLLKALESLPKSRVRRASELAANGRRPGALIDKLGLRQVERIYNADLTFQTLGAKAYLALAGWIDAGDKPIELPALVEERFVVELVRADGSRERLPLIGPLVGSDAARSRWDYGSDTARVQILDQCRSSGTFWDWAVARLDEPVELAITDTQSGETFSQLLWTDRQDVSSLSDTTTLTSCP